MKEQTKEQATPPAPVAQPATPPKRKTTVLEQRRIRSKERATAAPTTPRPGAKPPVLPTPPTPPRTVVTPTEIQAAAQPAQPAQPLMPAGEAVVVPEGNILELLFARAMRARSDTKPANDPGMAMIQALGHQVQHGKPLKDIEDIVVPQLGEMSAKIHLFLNAMAYHNMFERGSLLSLARWTLEKNLWEDLINNRLSPAEKLALLQLAIKEMDKVTTGLGEFQENLEGGGKGAGGDIEAATQRTDRLIAKVADPNVKDLDGTSPVGREIVRRMLTKAEGAANKIIQEAAKTK